MKLRVMKFGGSSVGSPDRLEQVTALIAREREDGPLAVVVSAMGDTTDWLIEAADLAARGELETAERVIDRVEDLGTGNGLLTLGALRLSARPEITLTVRELLKPLRRLLYGLSLLRERTPQTLDLVMSFGEQLSASILTEILRARGLVADLVDSRSWTVTDDRFGDAGVLWEQTQARLAAIKDSISDRVTVHTGFLGRTLDGRTTTLGRNGSDYTATLLARGLEATEVVIWTDVSGVMTADPNIVKDAYPTPRLTYTEALELANFGARMFHARTMIPLIESGIPMRIRNTMHPEDEGTRIEAGGIDYEDRPTCVTSLENQALLAVRWKRLQHEAHVGERVLRALDTAGVTVWMASQAAHGQAIAVVVPRGEVDRAQRAVSEALSFELARGDVDAVGVETPVTLLTLVAEKMAESENVAGRFFQTLSAIGVRVRAIAQGASSRSISCVIGADETATAVRSVHASFNLSHQEVNILLLGVGVVGQELLRQIQHQLEKLKLDSGIALKVAGLAKSDRCLFDPSGIEPRADVLASGESFHLDRAVELLERLRRLPVPILVDCTAADGLGSLYRAALSRGIHVVGANKKPLSGSMIEHRELLATARENHRAYRYETTVGASLPVIETLKNLIRTGDRVQLVEGSFSGSLGYIVNQVTDGVPLSRAVREAKERGYTEPAPQDDLSGLDVARKALILAREIGASIELDEISVEPLVPAALLAERNTSAFLSRLEEYDAEFAARTARLRSEGKTLRYLARIELDADNHARVTVGPTTVPSDHPATRLRGTEAFVAFRTERYEEYPLIVQGAGAGGAVTAAGVLADILAVAQSLRGR